ncbi:hypothetical protein Tco_1504868 [Tanacetum coccineum]
MDEDEDEEPKEDEVNKDDNEELKEEGVGYGEEEEIEIDDEMVNFEVIDPDKAEKGELPPPILVAEAATVSTGRLIKQDNVRAENIWLRMMLDCGENCIRTTRGELDRETWYYHQLRQWSIEVQRHLPPHLHYQEVLYVPPTALVVPIAHNDPRDPYVVARDAAPIPAMDDGDAAVAKDPQPSESRGSPCDPYKILISAGGPAAALVAQECTFAGFMKCCPMQFHETEGAVGLCRWFEKMESTFGISEYAERRKVKFATATLHGRALTWWNSQVATLGLEVCWKVKFATATLHGRALTWWNSQDVETGNTFPTACNFEVGSCSKLQDNHEVGFVDQHFFLVAVS